MFEPLDRQENKFTLGKATTASVPRTKKGFMAYN